MSAWLCSEDHINFLVNAMDVPDKAAAFKVLVEANIASLQDLYPGRDFLKEWEDDAATYRFKAEEPVEIFKRALENAPDFKVSTRYGRDNTFTRLPMTEHLLATQIVKSCRCFRYQACEPDSWEGSEAERLVETLREKTVQAGGQEDGVLYDKLLWGM